MTITALMLWMARHGKPVYDSDGKRLDLGWLLFAHARQGIE
jgi:hypothetical protein